MIASGCTESIYKLEELCHWIVCKRRDDNGELYYITLKSEEEPTFDELRVLDKFLSQTIQIELELSAPHLQADGSEE